MFGLLFAKQCKKEIKMDRALSKDYVNKRKRKIIIRTSVAVVTIATLFILLPGWRTPVANMKLYRVGYADKGDIETSFSAYGIVTPLYNEVITSPIATTVLRINNSAGDNITTTDTIIIPDIERANATLKKLIRERTIKENSIKRSKESIIQKLKQFSLALNADSIKIEQLASSLRKERELLNIGGGSQEKVDLAEMNYKVAKINRDKLIQEHDSYKALSNIDMNTSDIELSILNEKIYEQQTLINRSFIRSKRDGVITSLAVKPGQQISAGQQVATVANVNNFKITGSVPGKFADRLNYNMKVRVIIQDSSLYGHLSGIAPEIDGGSVSFTVTLDNPNHPLLRAQLKTDIRIIQKIEQDAIRLPFSDFYIEDAYVSLFVYNKGKLEKRKVLLGGCSYDYIEVKSGIKPGEKVVISKSLTEEFVDYTTIDFKNDYEN
jgi:HlyD family secretion protein